MWPFKNKPKERTPRQRDFDALVAWRKVGETFDYLGRTCHLVRHGRRVWIGVDFGYLLEPGIEADYVDNHGVIHRIEFEWGESMRLMEEQP